MKKDIEIPEMTDVVVAIVPSSNHLGEREWSVYLLNLKAEKISNVIINVSADGEINGQPKVTANLRFHFNEIAANSANPFEIVLPEAFHLRNQYWVSFFAEEKLYDKKFIAEANTIEEDNFEFIPLLTAMGIALH